jgi:hypothetical protein
LIDPSSAPVRSLPRSQRDLDVALANSWIVALDNVSGLSPMMSDALCRVATGGGSSYRKLYSDGDEAIFDAQRPIILTGIGDLVTREDLVDRSLFLVLPPLADGTTIPERQFWPAFHEARPRILGALLDAASMALRGLSAVQLPCTPRMVDFAQWVTAAEPALGWSPLAFLEAYQKNRQEAMALGLEGEPVAQAVQAMLKTQRTWSGTATDLYSCLTAVMKETGSRRSMPGGVAPLGTCLRRLAPALRAVGIEVKFRREPGSGVRRITLSSQGPTAVTAVTRDTKGRGSGRTTPESTDQGVTGPPSRKRRRG